MPSCLLAAEPAATTKAVDLIHALGCKGCHTIQGDGGTLAPDLTDIGSRMTATQMQQLLVQMHPAANNDKFMPAYTSVSAEDLKLISHYLYQLR